MNKQRIELILYPILSDSITDKQKEGIKHFYKKLSHSALEEFLANRLTREEAEKAGAAFSDKIKQNIYERSREIAAFDRISQKQEEALKDFAILLGIEEKETKIKTEDSKKEPETKPEETVESNKTAPIKETPQEIKDNPPEAGQTISEKDAEYRKILINFASITSVIAFFPLPVFDLLLIIPIQTAMVAKIIKLYDFDIEADKLRRALLGTLGGALAIKTIASIAGFFLPLAWVIHASITFAGTYALGILAKEYAAADGDISEESLKEIWKAALADGKEEFKTAKEYILKNKDHLIKKFNEIKKNVKEKQQDGRK